MTKRGRKPSEKIKGYFLEEQEEAVLEYLACESKEGKEKIYNEKLRAPFDKMVESIIRRYKLYIPDETSGETFTDTISFLLTKMDKFKPGNKTKAFSYYGTICKNHLIGRIETYAKGLQKNIPYESASEGFIDSIKYSDYNNTNAKIASESITMLINRIDEMLCNPSAYKLKENEIKMGQALKNFLENWDFVLSTDGSSKLNKNAVLFFLREATGFDTKGVRDNMRKFRNEFYEIKKYLIS